MANKLKFKRGLAAGIPNGDAAEPLFTTDTYDLYIGKGDGTNQRFQKYIASGATTQILRGDGSLYTFPLAISSPVAGQVLKYNGTSWTNDSDTDTGITTLNTLTATTQTFATGTSGTDFNISSATSTHTFNIPTASATNRGALSSADWTTFNNKQNALTNPITGSAASGQVAYFTGATTQAGSNNLFWDNTNARLGIGLNTPSSILNIYGSTPIFTISTTNNSVLHGIEFRAGTTFDASIKQLPSSGELQFNVGRSSAWGGFMTFVTDTTEKMRITSAGRLGIGTTTPGASLAVNGNAFFAAKITIKGNAAGTLGNSSGLELYQDAVTDTSYLYNFYNGPLLLGTNNTERVRIASSGNVGIGTASPAKQLDIRGNSSGAILELLQIQNENAGTNSGSSILLKGYYNVAKIIGVTQDSSFDYSGYLTFQVNNPSNIMTERLRITTNGQVNIGGNFTSTNNTLQVTGNVAIGTTTAAPANGLLVAGQITGSGVISAATNFRLNNQGFSQVAILDAGGSFAGGYNLTLSGTTPQHNSTGAISGYYYGSGGTIRFYADSSQTAGTNATERMRITSGGNLLLNSTTDNGNRLQVTGNIRLDASSNSFAYFINGGVGGWARGYRFMGNAGTASGGLWANGTEDVINYYTIGSAFNVGLTVNHTTANVSIGSTTDNGNRLQVTGNGYFSGNVGIGVSSPAQKLDVDGNIRIPSDSVIEWGWGSTKISGSTSTHALTFTTWSGSSLVERMRITSAGNVGIGTTGPVLRLDVQGNASDTTTISGVTVEQVSLFRPSNGVGGIRTGFNTSTGDVYLWSSNSGSSLNFGTRSAPNNTAHLSIAFTGAATFSSTTTATAFIPNGSSVPTNGMYLPTTNTLAWATNTTERMRLTSAGELLINTTSDAGDYKLQVAGNAYMTDSVVINGTSSTTGSLDVYKGVLGVSANARLRVSGDYADAYQFRILGISAGNFNSTTYASIDNSGNGYFAGNLGVGVVSPTEKLEVNGNIKTAAPSGGTAKPWKLGEVTGGTGTHNNSIKVEVDGSIYYLMAYVV